MEYIVKNNYFGQLAKQPNTLKFGWPYSTAHLVGHEKLHDALSIRIRHYTDNCVIILKKKAIS